MPKPTLIDTLRTSAADAKLGLIDLLGKDLYNIFESGKVEKELPYGFKSRLDFRNKNLNLRKEFGDNYRLDFDVNKMSPRGYKEDLRIGITKKF